MPLPPSTAIEGQTLAAMTARADPDTRRIVDAGQKVLAMLAAISQLSKEALQVRNPINALQHNACNDVTARTLIQQCVAAFSVAR